MDNVKRLKHKKRSPAYPLLPLPDQYCRVNDKLKKKYATQLDAELNAPVTGLQQYICEYCGYWHNGSRNQRNQ